MEQNKPSTSEGAQPPVAATCPACGEPLEPGARFCEDCGYDLESVPEGPAPGPGPVGGPGPEPAGDDVARPAGPRSPILWLIAALWAALTVMGLVWLYGRAMSL